MAPSRHRGARERSPPPAPENTAEAEERRLKRQKKEHQVPETLSGLQVQALLKP